MALIADPADAYRRARQLLTGSPLLPFPERSILQNDVFAYTDALEEALRLLQKRVTQPDQAAVLARLLAALTIAHDDDHTLVIQTATMLALEGKNVHIDIAQSETEVRITATIEEVLVTSSNGKNS